MMSTLTQPHFDLQTERFVADLLPKDDVWITASLVKMAGGDKICREGEPGNFGCLVILFAPGMS